MLSTSSVPPTEHVLHMLRPLLYLYQQTSYLMLRGRVTEKIQNLIIHFLKVKALANLQQKTQLLCEESSKFSIVSPMNVQNR
jgi:hypothetical protein